MKEEKRNYCFYDPEKGFPKYGFDEKEANKEFLMIEISRYVDGTKEIGFVRDFMGGFVRFSGLQARRLTELQDAYHNKRSIF